MTTIRVLIQSAALIACLTLSLISTAAADTPKLLFIGNSYTYGNDLDQMTAQLMAKASADWASVTANRHAVGGARFVQHLAEADGTNGDTALRGKLLGEPYFAVMLQEQSQIPGFPQGNQMYQESSAAFAGLNQLVEANGAHTVALMTWGRRSGDSQNALRYPDFKTMQSHLKDGYFQYAQASSTDARTVTVVPAGLAFEKIYDDLVAAGEEPLNEDGLFWKLYSGDGSHPALTGTYLTACTIYASLTGQRLEGLEWAPEGIDAATRDTLQSAANFAVFDSQQGEDAPNLFINQAQAEPEPDSEPEPEVEEPTQEQEETSVSPEPESQPVSSEPSPESGGCAGCVATGSLPIYFLLPVFLLFRRRWIQRRP